MGAGVSWPNRFYKLCREPKSKQRCRWWYLSRWVFYVQQCDFFYVLFPCRFQCCRCSSKFCDRQLNFDYRDWRARTDCFDIARHGTRWPNEASQTNALSILRQKQSAIRARYNAPAQGRVAEFV